MLKWQNLEVCQVVVLHIRAAGDTRTTVLPTPAEIQLPCLSFENWSKVWFLLVSTTCKKSCKILNVIKDCSLSWEQIKFLKYGQMVSQLELGELTWYSLHRWSQWPQLASVAPFRCTAPHLCHALGGASMIFQAVLVLASQAPSLVSWLPDRMTWPGVGWWLRSRTVNSVITGPRWISTPGPHLSHLFWPKWAPTLPCRYLICIAIKI